MVSGALAGVGRIKHEYKREKKKKIPCHTVALGIDLRRSPLQPLAKKCTGTRPIRNNEEEKTRKITYCKVQNFNFKNLKK